MSGTQIAFLICGILFIFFVGLAIWGYIHRKNQPYSITDIENSNWFMKFVKSNILLIWIMVIAMLLIIAIAFFVSAFGKNT